MTYFNISLSLILGFLGVTASMGCFKSIIIGQSMFIEWSLLSSAGLELEVSLIIDVISLMFFSSVAWISCAVILFSRSYMKEDFFYIRFHLLVLSFISSMFILIFSPNLISILLGWDGLGVTSYLLVIYYQSSKSFNAGLLTALTNRLGDVGILLVIGLTISSGSWNFALQSLEFPSESSLIFLVLVLAAMTKSAQIPFSAWLPAAMAAPTPVSALVHSSTLVTAGVYLLIRFNNQLLSFKWLDFLLFSGVITMLMAGVAAMFETDMKKMVALSTLSQLGLMMSSLGIGTPKIAFFHLLSHAYFKALLFMCAGNIIHCSNDFQDLRQMGMAYFSLPLTTSFMNLSNLSLCGFPFMAGFYSKDAFLECSLMGCYNKFAVVLFFVATLLTAAYSFRFTVLTSVRPPQFYSLIWSSDEDQLIVSGNFFLMGLATTGGSILTWSLFDNPSFIFLPLTLKILAFLVTVMGVLFSLNFKHSLLSPLSVTSALMWNLPLVSARIPSGLGLPISSLYRLTGDLGWFNIVYHQAPSITSTLMSISSQSKRELKYSSLLFLSSSWALLITVLFIFWIY